ncbi:MAG: DUF934 domain-containing protein [Acidiferrobacterales bacterium]|nr:DUF934 domain-containing protein [Acidiferrobacterales bacterium]
MAGDKNLKKRPKAGPSRIQENIQNANVIRDKQVVKNDMLHLAESENLTVANLPTSNVSVPMSFWTEYKTELLARGANIAVQIAADEDPLDIAEDLNEIATIVLPFVTYVDGRSYSHAHKLRTQLSFQGEIRAVGDVHFDQLDFLKRVGCDAFELPDEDNQQAALAAFSEFSEVYQPSADQGRLIFSRRRAIH